MFYIQNRHGPAIFLAGKAATVQCQPHHGHASVAATAFYSAKSRHDLDLWGLARRSRPEIEA